MNSQKTSKVTSNEWREEAMTTPSVNVQDGFLFQSLKAETPVKLLLMTGEVLQGTIKRFDRFAVVIEVAKREVLVYKHAIATLEPSE